jgi:hypothetical protein
MFGKEKSKMTAWTISSKTDIKNYIGNEHPDFRGMLSVALVDAIQASDHPDYGDDWAEWFDKNINQIRDDVSSD